MGLLAGSCTTNLSCLEDAPLIFQVSGQIKDCGII